MKHLSWVIVGLIALAYPFGEYLPALVPETVWGLAGIVFAPFKHATLSHLVMNLLPLAYLLWVLSRDRAAYVLTGLAFIVVVGGTFVWFEGRPAIHEGASGLTLGILGILALRHGFETAICVSALVATAVALEMNNGLNVSWEMHAGGYLAGLYYAYIAMRWYKPKEQDHDDEPSSAQTAPCPPKCGGYGRPHCPGARRRTDPRH